jgi:hypothetical protein
VTGYEYKISMSTLPSKLLSWKSTKTAGRKLRTEVWLINAAKSLKYNTRLSMIIFNVGRVTT